MKFKFALIAIGALALSGCGSSLSCSNSDVVATLKDAIMDSFHDPMMASIGKQNISIGAITTEQSDAENGNYVCGATLSFSQNGKTREIDIDYAVKSVADEDSDFQIEYDAVLFQNIANQVGAEVRRSMSP